MMPSVRAKLVLSVAFWAMLMGGHTCSAEDASEYQLKGAFLFKFAVFVEWPASAFESSSAPLEIGILGADPFGPDFDRTIAQRTAGGRPVVVKRFRNVADVGNIHILFICASEQARLPAILDSLKNRKTLLVGESEEFCMGGGMIGLLRTGESIRIGINVDAAKKAGLAISSELLRLARIIRAQREEK